jgi:hypothetical protein
MSVSSTALAALLSEEMSFFTIAGSGVINAHLAGRDPVMIARSVNYAPYEMVLSKDIRTVKDLKGKKLGIAHFGGSEGFFSSLGIGKARPHAGRMSLSYNQRQSGTTRRRLARSRTHSTAQGKICERSFLL